MSLPAARFRQFSLMKITFSRLMGQIFKVCVANFRFLLLAGSGFSGAVGGGYDGSGSQDPVLKNKNGDREKERGRRPIHAF